ncbi:hypothetical protein [Quatrionicoccus australiensis]|uniref:hypothetical protein n=1 Tax=Quatrionicoccus australiensis TaxID=138118 RepID=UPI001CFB1A1E|nr:hypothetical protein [Quatrionicoccus australiensis]MCB4361214.1 hypothetical protein [Quatrionicoccus australiensis]
MPSPIIARADALMQKRRQNLAGADEVPVLIDALDDEDIPILLLVDTPAPVAELASSLAETRENRPDQPDDVAPPPTAAPPELMATADQDASHDEHLVRELTRRIEARLSAELPAIIAATVRDFLAEQKTAEEPPKST